MAFNLQWVLNNSPAASDLYFDVTFPNRTSDVLTLSLASPASSTSTQEILTNVSIYLDGPDADLLLSWTHLSVKDNFNGGLEISQNGGRDWVRFNLTAGNKQDSTTWIILSATSIGALGQDGVLNPYDTATILLRVVVPPSFSDYRILAFNIGVDFDVI